MRWAVRTKVSFHWAGVVRRQRPATSAARKMGVPGDESQLRV